MDIDRMIQGLDAYFENTPKEHFEEVWKNVKKYERSGFDVNELLNGLSPSLMNGLTEYAVREHRNGLCLTHGQVENSIMEDM